MVRRFLTVFAALAVMTSVGTGCEEKKAEPDKSNDERGENSEGENSEGENSEGENSEGENSEAGGEAGAEEGQAEETAEATGPWIDACDFPRGHCIERKMPKKPTTPYKMECDMKQGTVHAGGCPDGALARCIHPESPAGTQLTFYYYDRHESSKPSEKNQNTAWKNEQGRCTNVMTKGTWELLAE